jgi:phosphoadenosine phosphosulfate reductase
MNYSNATIDLATIARELEHQGPTAILEWAIDEFGSELSVATGFGPSGIVNLHQVSQIDSSVKAFYIDTGLLHKETYTLRDQLQTRLGITITAVHPELTLTQQAEQYGSNLWQPDPDLCCLLRKVAPLRRYLADKRAWVTGIRRDQTATRTSAQVVEWDVINGLVKINPLAGWSMTEVWAYIYQNNLPFNPLHLQGYPSIGCWPCTQAVQSGDDPRAGRWAGHPKIECGLHMRNDRFRNDCLAPAGGE